MSMFEDLWDSSTSLIERFNFKQDVDAATFKFNEEVAELLHEVKLYKRSLYPDSNSIIEEAVDVMVTLVNLLTSMDVSRDEFVHQMEAVIYKNDMKSRATHEVKTITMQHIGRK